MLIFDGTTLRIEALSGMCLPSGPSKLFPGSRLQTSAHAACSERRRADEKLATDEGGLS